MNQNQQQQQQQRPGAPAPAPEAAGGGDTRTPAQRLKELHELHKAGVLSDEEYSAKRAELMKLL
jgi:hypothetical protein